MMTRLLLASAVALSLLQLSCGGVLHGTITDSSSPSAAATVILDDPIHVSVAELLPSASKSVWVQPGEKDTADENGNHTVAPPHPPLSHWLDTSHRSLPSMARSSSKERTTTNHGMGSGGAFPTKRKLSEQDAQEETIQGLVDWNTKNWLQLLQQIVAHRQEQQADDDSFIREAAVVDWNIPPKASEDYTVMDEVQKILHWSIASTLPSRENVRARNDTVHLSPAVVQQMYDYVSMIASMYNPENPFHNFGKASFRASCVWLLVYILFC
jgi:hypothetical protein